MSRGLAGRVLASAARIVTTLLLVLISASAAVAQTTVTAQWDRNADSQTAGYRLYYGTAPGSYQWSVDAGSQTSAPITLSAGSVYYFTVRAYDANYEYSAPSNEASIDLGQGTGGGGGGGGASAPTAQLTATLQSANTALVTWQTTNAVTATLNGSTLSAASGSASIYVNGTTTFTLVATNAAGAVATQSATVNLAAPPSSGLHAEITATMQTGNTALVTWQTANTVRATINGSPLNAASGSASVYVTGSTTFTLVAWDANGATVTRSASVTPGGAPTTGVTAEITATMQTANTALVTWHTANATRATLNGSPLNAASGTASVYVSGTTTFTLVAADATGAAVTRSATVTPSGSEGGGGTPPNSPSGPTAQITATMQNANTALVTWYTANATRATLNGSPLNAASGSASVYVSGTTTFTLVATNAAGVVTTQSATVAASGGSTSGATAQITATLQSANTALLTWHTANAARATLNGSPLNAASGTASVYVNGPTTFTLVVWDATGASITRTATVNGEAPTSGPTAELTAVMQSANTVVVTWHTANATRATLNGSPLNAASGTASYWVNGTVTFTLVATDANGVAVTRSATVP